MPTQVAQNWGAGEQAARRLGRRHRSGCSCPGSAAGCAERLLQGRGWAHGTCCGGASGSTEQGCSHGHLSRPRAKPSSAGLAGGWLAPCRGCRGGRTRSRQPVRGGWQPTAFRTRSKPAAAARGGEEQRSGGEGSEENARSEGKGKLTLRAHLFKSKLKNPNKANTKGNPAPRQHQH